MENTAFLQSKNMVRDINILNDICKFYNKSVSDVITDSRKREFVEIRQIFMHFLQTELKAYQREASLIFGQSRLMSRHSKKTINNLRQTDKSFKLKHDELLAKLAITYKNQRIKRHD